jgi:ATP-dependent helicase HrpB
MLPIESHLSAIVKSVTEHPVTLLEASPGSGKTTLVPLALMRHFAGKVLVLEPRKLATRLAAQRVASLIGQKSGEDVGHMYRFEQKVGPDTRLIFLTEGTFLAYLKSNPTLVGIDAVVLDEFHERHLTTDLAFGFLHRLKKPPRLLIMSATLDEMPLRRHYPELKKITVTTPVFPLSFSYPPQEVDWLRRPLERKVMWGIQEGWKHPGDMLVFLPGLSEIKRVAEILRERLGEWPARVLILHGQEASDEKELMSVTEERKIILASNVAESSVTIPGVRIVIDAGLQRETEFSAWSGRTELVTNLCSKASAIQRAGRAARTASGVCIRLYPENDFEQRARFSTPEIFKTDLADVVLELASWHIPAAEFAWVDAPESKKIQHAQELLTKLAALTAGKITRTGSLMQEAGLPVRAARVWAAGIELASPAAFKQLCSDLAHWQERGAEAKKLADRLAARRVSGSESRQELFWLTGFADAIAKGRSDDVVTVTGETYKLSPEARKVWDPRHPYWLVLDVQGQQKIVTRLLALDTALVFERAQEFKEQLFDEKRGKMIERTTLKLGALTLKTEEIVIETQHAVTRGPLERAARVWLQNFQASTEGMRWELMQTQLFPDKSLQLFEWELFLEEFLLEDALPTAESERDFLQRLRQELQIYLDSSFQVTLKNTCPTHYELHAKRSCEIHYEAGKPPWIETHIQDFFGLKHHPALFNGKLPLTIHLWGPHGRALQVTADLFGFWERHYPNLRKELMRDYPRHFWPEEPRTAEPMLRIPRPPR